MNFDPLCIINVRDRVTPLRALVSWLETAGHQRIVLLDNDSTYEPLLEYFEYTPHVVVKLGGNGGARALWDAELLPDEYFVYTDPDIVPTEDCPLDAVRHLHELLQRYPRFQKAGLGLYLEDLPVSMPSLLWERSLISPSRRLERGVYDSLIDTTFALYRPNTPFMYEAIRTATPYAARHTSWYTSVPDVEDRYYLERAIQGPLGSSWAEKEAA